MNTSARRLIVPIFVTEVIDRIQQMIPGIIFHYFSEVDTVEFEIAQNIKGQIEEEVNESKRA